jgi:hypothetical protein
MLPWASRSHRFLSRLARRSMAGAAFTPGWLTFSWIVGSLLCTGRLDRLRECHLDIDAADLDAVFFSSTRAVVTRTWAMVASTSGEGLACWRRANATPRLAWGLLNVGSPASSNSRRKSRAHGGTAWCCSSTRLWVRFALAWIRRASSESVASTRGGSFAETTKTRRRVDLWSLGRCGARPFETLRRPETWEPEWCARRRAPDRSSSVADSHGVSAMHPCGRCTVRREGHGVREVRP